MFVGWVDGVLVRIGSGVWGRSGPSLVVAVSLKEGSKSWGCGGLRPS